MYELESFQQLLGRLPSEGAERLERILDRISAGTSVDLRTPLYDSRPREEIIKELEEKIGYTEFEELTAIDEHERDKIGPFSIMLPASERRESLDKYWHQTWNPDESCLVSASQRVKAILPERSLRPDSLRTAYDLMPKDTSLGLPWLTRDRALAGDYLTRAITDKLDPETFFPCVWFWRGQPKGLTETPKQRDVWGFDHKETIKGATILYPLLRALRHRPGFSAWLGDYWVDEEATRLLNRAHGRRIISGDYSGFDSSLSRQMLNVVDDVICYWFVESAHPDIRLLGEVSATIPIVVPYEVLSGRNGGMPSGSVLTNMRDTIANLLAGFYCAYRLSSDIEDYLVLGDDSVFLFKDDIDSESLATVMSEIGLVMNPEKQFVSTTSIHYLQRWHSLQYMIEGRAVGVHSPYRTLSGMLGYERYRNNWNKWMDTARWIMQVENTRHDPRFRRFVSFLVDGDKVLQSGVDPATVFKRAGGSDVIRSVLDIASFPFNSKNPDKVSEFQTTGIIREMSR